MLKQSMEIATKQNKQFLVTIQWFGAPVSCFASAHSLSVKTPGAIKQVSNMPRMFQLRFFHILM